MRRLLGLLLLTLPVACWCQSRTFQNPLLIPTSGDPAALATGDWNGDGKQDLAYIDSASNPSLHILLGNGNGTFTVGQTIALAPSSCSYNDSTHSCFLFQADVNGDGKPDFVFLSTPSFSGTITVLLGNGDGTFAAPIVTTFATDDSDPPMLETIAGFGDFNGDGKLDIAVADYYGYVTVFIGDGAGHFTPGFHPSSQTGPYAVYTGDFNNDGKLDLLTLSGQNPAVAQVYYGNGSGSFTTGPFYYMAGGRALYADVNGDGIPDLIGWNGANIWVMLGKAGGGFAASVQIPATLSTDDQLIRVADVNGDGIADLIFSTGTGIKIMLGQGNLNFGQPSLATTGNISSSTLAVSSIYGNNIKDIAAGTAGGIVLFHGNANVNFSTTTIMSAGQNVLGAIAGKFTHSGLADLLLLQSTSTVQTFLGTSAGTLAAGPSLTLPSSPGALYQSAVADFDGDGNLDVALSNIDLQVLYGKGDGSFTLMDTGYWISSVSGGNILFAGDLNGDKKIDLLTVTGPNYDVSFSPFFVLAAFLNSGSRSFTRVNTLIPYTTVISEPYLLGAADLNHDGFLDAVVYETILPQTGLPGLQIMLGNGDGTFRVGNTVSIPSTMADAGTLASSGITYLGDIDGDGNPDFVLLAPNASGTALYIFYGDGAGGFSAPQCIRLSEFYEILNIADIYQNGSPDFVVSSQNLVTIIPNLGRRNFGSEVHYVAGNLMGGVVPTDINGDGYPDLFVDYSNIYEPSGMATILLNVSGSPATAGGQPAQATVVATPQTVSYSQPFTLTAVVSSLNQGSPAPTGSAQFSINGQSIGSAQLQSGTATLSVPGSITQTLKPGQQSLSAVYSGDATYAPAIADSTITVLAAVYPTVSTLTFTPATIQAGQFVTLNAVVTAPATVQNGVVTFLDGQSVLGQTSISQTGTASLQTNLFSLGANSLTVTYQGFTPPPGSYSGTANFLVSTSAPVVLTVNALATSIVLTSSSSSLASGTVLTLTAKVSSTSTPYGGITFFDGSTPLGTMALDDTGSATYSTASLVSGTHELSASYEAIDPFAPSTSSNVPVTVKFVSGQGSSVLISSSNANSVGPGIQLVVSVNVVSGHPTGTITLLEDNQVVGLTPVSATTGQTSFSIAINDSSVHRVYASYSGDSVFVPNASPQFVTTTYTFAPDFMLSLGSTKTPASISLSGTAALNVIGMNGWTGTAQLTCSPGLPVGYTCSFLPASVTGSGQAVLTITPSMKPSPEVVGWLGLVFTIPIFRKRRWLRKCLFGILTLTICLGCGTIRDSPTDAPLSALTVQASTGAIVHSLQIEVK
jgi:hypothetical protein